MAQLLDTNINGTLTVNGAAVATGRTLYTGTTMYNGSYYGCTKHVSVVGRNMIFHYYIWGQSSTVSTTSSNQILANGNFASRISKTDLQLSSMNFGSIFNTLSFMGSSVSNTFAIATSKISNSTNVYQFFLAYSGDYINLYSVNPITISTSNSVSITFVVPLADIAI